MSTAPRFQTLRHRWRVNGRYHPARTLLQAGHRVTVFEKAVGLGGRMATRDSAFGSFDHGNQHFTVRDPRFQLALDTTPNFP